KAVSNANPGAFDCLVVAESFLPADVPIATVKPLACKGAVASRYVYVRKPVSIIMLNEVHEESFVVKLRVKAYVFDIRHEIPIKSHITEFIIRELKKKGLNPIRKVTKQENN